MKPTVIGTVDIGEGEEFQQTYETAAWHTEVALTPGTYDVIATNPRSYVGFHVRVPGVVTSSFLPALFGGVPVGSSPQGERHPDVGKEREIVKGVGIDQITLNEVGLSTLARYWISSPRHLEFSGPGLKAYSHAQIVPIPEIWGMDWRIDPNNGGLAEFCSETAILVDRVNELQAEGFDPDVWQILNGDDKRPWFETPFEDHRPYKERKFQDLSYEDSKRYYREKG